MPRAGRNEPCPCGSGRKVKRCCGQQRGPSDDDLARAHIAILAREAAADIADLPDYALDDLWEQLLELPALDISLLVELPKLITPDLQRLQEAIADDDPTGAGTPSPPSPHRSTHHDNVPDSPTRSSRCAAATASTANKPQPRSSTSTAAPPASSPPACSKPSPSQSA